MKSYLKDNNLTQDNLNTIINVSQYYEKWLAQAKEIKELPTSMYWHTVGNKKYLYQKNKKQIKNIGRENKETIDKYEKYIKIKQQLNEDFQKITNILSQELLKYRLMRLPRINATAAKILRHLDINQVLGEHYLVVGTNAFGIYEIMAKSYFKEKITSTDDFDLTWQNKKIDLTSNNIPILLKLLKEVDDSFTINKNKPYQATNSKGYEVELLTSIKENKTLHKNEVFSPYPIMEQEWLLLGKQEKFILLADDMTPAPLVVPDPRWMALHKIWLSHKNTRNILKRDKDLLQGQLLLEVVYEKMYLDYPLDHQFINEVKEQGCGLIDIINDFLKHKPIKTNKIIF